MPEEPQDNQTPPDATDPLSLSPPASASVAGRES